VANLDDFFTALCRRMGWEPTAWRLNVLKTMAQMEGYPNIIQLEQTWNPLDTTHPAGKVGNWNSVGVGIYPNQAAGVEATAKTLEQSNFTNLRNTLQTQKVNQGTAADLQLWGWNSPNLLNSILNAMGGGSVTAAGGTTMTQPTTTTRGTTLGEWIEQQGYVSPDPAEWNSSPGAAGLDWYTGQPASIKETIYNEWRTATGQGETAATVTPTEAAGLAGGLGDVEANRLVQEYEWKVEQGKIKPFDALNELTAKLRASEEAGRRAEAVTTTMEERYKRAIPAPYFPGLEPGGFLQQIAAKWGEPATPTYAGTPMSQMPNPWDAYKTGMTSMGLPEQMPNIQLPQTQQPEMPNLAAPYGPYTQVVNDILSRAGYGAQAPDFASMMRQTPTPTLAQRQLLGGG
jgi:hypothetical protein